MTYAEALQSLKDHGLDEELTAILKKVHRIETAYSDAMWKMEDMRYETDEWGQYRR